MDYNPREAVVVIPQVGNNPQADARRLENLRPIESRPTMELAPNFLPEVEARLTPEGVIYNAMENLELDELYVDNDDDARHYNEQLKDELFSRVRVDY